MYGAIIGDICGSIYEFNNYKTDNPAEITLCNPDCTFTDDTVLTCAFIDALLTKRNYTKAAYRWANRYPNRVYGTRFALWFTSLFPKPYYSYGNGAAMRVSAIGWAFDTIEETLDEAKRSAEITHNHPEGIKGAEATVMAIYLARKGRQINEIREFISKNYYPLNFTIDEIRPSYRFNETCQETVPQAIEAFLESVSFEDALRTGISLGGDSDTIGAITGAIAEAYYGIPVDIGEKALAFLDDDMKSVLTEWKKFISSR